MIVDSHQDIATNALYLGRDFLLSAHDKRAKEFPPNPLWGISTVGLPDLERANVRVVFASIWAPACDNPTKIPVKPCYKTPEEACALGQKQLSYYQNLTRNQPLALVTTKQSLQNVISADYRLGLIISMEGADPILSPAHLHEWVSGGLRVIGLAHGRTRYSGGTGKSGPLTPLGRELLAEMKREPLVLDLSHMAEASFFEALELFHGSVIATHSNCRALIPTDRHLSDEMIRAIVRRGGVIGIALFNRFLRADWDETGRVKERVTLADFMKQVNHICDLAGDTTHVGIGSDFDGGFGSESIPSEMDTAADLPKIADALSQSGYAHDDIVGMMGVNWLDFLKKTLPE